MWRSSERKSGTNVKQMIRQHNSISNPLNRLTASKIEESIVNANFKGTSDYHLKFEDFVHRLKIPADDFSFTLFSLFAADEEQGVIDFQEYLLQALFLIKIQQPKIELVRLLFNLFGDSGRLRRESFRRVLKHFVKLSTDEIDKLFYSIDCINRGSIVFEDFRKATENQAKYQRLYEPNRNFRQRTN